MKAILIVSPEPWIGNQVSKHHYARTLAARGHRVVFLDPPDASLSSLAVTQGLAGEVPWIVRGPRVAPGLRFMPALLRRTLERSWIESIEKTVGFPLEIVWLFENSRFYDMSFAADRIRIYHQVDLNQDYHVAEALASSDLQLTNTSATLRRFSALGAEGHKIDHGVSAGSLDKLLIRDPRLRQGRPTAAYVGNLDIPYLDLSLLFELFSSFPQIDFHLIGSYSPGNPVVALTASAENVFWWGRIESSNIVPTLRAMDILLLTYDAERWREQLANSHKLMEYMASGVVTVATFTEEYADKRHLLAMADRREDFVPLFARVIENLAEWNSREKREARIAFAHDNTYDRQIDRISEILAAVPRYREQFGDIRL